jgi:hypothetical protein
MSFFASKGSYWRGQSSDPTKLVQNDTSDQPLCQLCSKRDHTANRCYKRFDNTYRPPPPRPPSRQRQSKPQALFVQPDLAPPDT